MEGYIAVAEEIFSYRTVVEHAVVVCIFTLVSSNAPIVKRSMKCLLREDSVYLRCGSFTFCSGFALLSFDKIVYINCI